MPYSADKRIESDLLAVRARRLSRKVRPAAETALVELGRDELVGPLARRVINLAALDDGSPEISAHLRIAETDLGAHLLSRYPIIAVYWLGPQPITTFFDAQNLEGAAELDESVEVFNVSDRSSDVGHFLSTMNLLIAEAIEDQLTGRPDSPLNVYRRYAGALAALYLTNDENPELDIYRLRVDEATSRAPRVFTRFYDTRALEAAERGGSNDSLA